MAFFMPSFVKKPYKITAITVFCACILCFKYGSDAKEMKIKLNPPYLKGGLRVLLESRFSCRDFQDKPLNLDEVTNILWAGAGKKYDSIASASRTAPSAGATHPLQLYILAGQNGINKLKEGLYHYSIEEHSLTLVTGGDKRKELSDACLGQDFIKIAPVSLIITADFRRTTSRYGSRGQNYVYMEAGHASQNIYLAVTSLGLGTVEVGAFIDDKVSQALGIEKTHTPLLVMPIGYPQAK